MQPDPLIFLRGIRRELLQTGNSLLGGGDFVQGVTLLRGGELVANLLLRLGHLPALLDGLYQRQHELLQRSSAQLTRFDMAIPDDVAAALQAQDAGDTIARFDAARVAQSRCLFDLSQCPEQAGVKQVVNQLAQEACMLEADYREVRDEALAAIRASDTATTMAGDKMTPTDEIITAHLRAQFPQYPEIRASNVRQQKGVNTKEVFFMDLHGHPDWPPQAVMRRNRAVDSVGNDVSCEFGILDYVCRHGVRAPRALFAGHVIGSQKRPYVVLEKREGRAQSAGEFGNAARDVLLDMARNLAVLHRVAVRGMSDDYRLYGSAGGSARDRTLKMIDRFYAMWQEFNFQPSLTTESAYIWLRENVGLVDDRVVIVHGDYSMRNNLAHEGRISAILDWELAHEGHPGEDLGYVRLDVEGAMSWPEFMQAYVDAGGVPVPDEVVRYFRIYGLAFIMGTLYSACSGYLTGQHSDLLIGAAGTIEFNLYESLLAKCLLAEYRNDDAGRLGRSI